MRYIQQNGILVPQTSRNRQRGFITCGPAFFGGAAAPSPGDPYWSYVVSLLHFDGPDGSTAFADQIGARSWSITGGSPVISTATPKFGSGAWSAGGTGASAISSAIPAIGTQDYTAECFAYGQSGSSLFWMSSFLLIYVVSGYWVLNTGGTNAIIGPAPSSGYDYVKVYRQSGVLHLIVNNADVGTVTDARDYTTTSFNIGFISGASSIQTIDEFRLTVGVARTDTTVPTAPFPNHA